MESVRKAHQRMRNYPILLAKCAESATVYADCVARDLNIKHHTCDKEFQLFKNCLQKAAKDMKTRI
ncbi:uncharacterized protein LOC129940032 [Eupeodes corollae]|uniref:uncharacterized protein LOC129940032 n=1 Tax=Eupeodes corollae TaxID=290404 RepID=UPI00248F7D76|nr:uncharacterized protein LOC129940032 [Eupeodes corollae]